MLSERSQRVASDAKSLYETKLRAQLEIDHHGEFVCIEPESQDYFLGRTLDEAVNQALEAHPDRLTHTLRVGHAAAIHMGAMPK